MRSHREELGFDAASCVREALRHLARLSARLYRIRV
jgi:hypothetical protein